MLDRTQGWRNATVPPEVLRGLLADLCQALGDRAVVLVPADAGDIADLRDTAAQQDDYLPLRLVQEGEEVGEHQSSSTSASGPCTGMVSVSSTNRTLTLERLWYSLRSKSSRAYDQCS